MKLSYFPYALEFKHPFGLSHSTRTHTDVVYVRLEKDGKEGFGEAALPPYLGETQDSVIDFLKKATSTIIEIGTDLSKLPSLEQVAAGNSAAKAAIDIALHDLVGMLKGQPVHQLLNLPKPIPKETSVTIGIGNVSLIPQKLEELKDFHLIKVKLGNRNDKEIIEAIRRVTDKPLAVDVNQGWRDKNFALEMIGWLGERNTVYVEQPLAKENLKDAEWLRAKSPLPLLADESFQRLADLAKVSAAYNGINLKLMKSEGIREGALILQEAKKKDLKINIGCMSESSCGIAAAAQLMQQADWIDLDGPMLIKNDPFGGVNFRNGKLEISGAPGTGAVLREDLAFLPL